MRPPRLANAPLIDWLANSFSATEQNMKYAGLPRGTIRGTISSVDDPEKRGRVKVVFDAMNPDIPQVTGAGEYSEARIGEKPEESHWIDMSPSFKGTQPKGLVGTRVNISVSEGEFQYAIGQDVLYDPELLTEKASKEMKMPKNSTMTRLPIYESGSLPPASEENHGCMAVESGGPMQSDWLCVCLRRNGKYVWVRHIDLSHGHAGQNDSTQKPDSRGDNQQTINNATVWDYVFPTTAGAMSKQSSYGTGVRPNPFGGQAKWQGGAK
jgi:hypothetical protein